MSEAMNWKQRALYQLMSDISENCYCAGWMHGNEYTLWKMVADPTASRRYGQSEVTDEEIAELKAISDDIGGWIRWHDDEDEPDLGAEEWGPRFEPLAEWQARYERHMAQHAALAARLGPK
jgi:hypothetical protein